MTAKSDNDVAHNHRGNEQNDLKTWLELKKELEFLIRVHWLLADVVFEDDDLDYLNSEAERACESLSVIVSAIQEHFEEGSQ